MDATRGATVEIMNHRMPLTKPLMQPLRLSRSRHAQGHGSLRKGQPQLERQAPCSTITRVMHHVEFKQARWHHVVD